MILKENANKFEQVLHDVLQSGREYRHLRIASAVHEWRRLARIREWRTAISHYNISAAIR